MAATPTTDTWKDWLPFSDLKGFVRFALGTAIILVVFRLAGVRKLIGA